jgi:NitT/TauT family transport system permease protein
MGPSTRILGSRQGPRPPRAADLAFSTALLIALWKLGSMAVGIDMVLPPPERVLSVFINLVGSPRFLQALGATALRGLAAFALSMLLGGIVGFFIGSSPRFKTMIGPALTVIRATPVLAIILLALVWFPSGIVPVFSALVMAFPVVASDVAAGVASADPKLLEMARLFGLSRKSIALELRIPAALPHLVAGAKNALGLSWKVVVAGEVLSQPSLALGTGMQNARIMLETAEVFAWAAAGVLLCALSDALFDRVAGKLAWPTV